jgi:hypothetical protein
VLINLDAIAALVESGGRSPSEQKDSAPFQHGKMMILFHGIKPTMQVSMIDKMNSDRQI